MKALLSCDELAEQLSVSHWTIRSWISRGTIRSVKIGRRRLIPQGELQRIAREGLPSLASSPRNDGESGE